MEENLEETGKETGRETIGAPPGPSGNHELSEGNEHRPSSGSFPVANATLFYTALTGVGLLWRWIAGREPLFPLAGLEPSEAIATGCLSGVVIAAAAWAACRMFAWAREIEKLLSNLVGPLGPAAAFVVALASSVGEETFFRAAVQTSTGLLPASALFAIAHFPLERKLVPWTAEAFLVGMLLGWMFEHYQGLAGPISCHFAINFIGLVRLGGNFSVRRAPW
ncbi:CPBP family intramembrane metalloprotease [Candidatus Parcubacteria bacterium]|nr:MAG: CPBP family intramembrane metalloprotease [Candidatus Parcubacteria bacterium]